MTLINPLKDWVTHKRKNQFNQLLETHYAKLYRLGFAWSQQKTVAQDLVQETMLKAIEKQHQLENLKDLELWLCKIIHNLYRDRLRYQQQWQFAEAEDIDYYYSEQSCEEGLIAQQTQLNVHQAIGLLAIEQREVVTLVDLQGCSYQETAEILEVPVGTVMSRLSRARQKLKTLLEERNDDVQSSNVIYLRRKK